MIPRWKIESVLFVLHKTLHRFVGDIRSVDSCRSYFFLLMVPALRRSKGYWEILSVSRSWKSRRTSRSRGFRWWRSATRFIKPILSRFVVKVFVAIMRSRHSLSSCSIPPFLLNMIRCVPLGVDSVEIALDADVRDRRHKRCAATAVEHGDLSHLLSRGSEALEVELWDVVVPAGGGHAGCVAARGLKGADRKCLAQEAGSRSLC